MAEKEIKSTPLRPDGGRKTDSTMMLIDLPAAMKQIREETSWKTGDRNAITLLKSNRMRVVLVALHEGAEIPRHIAEGMISVQVLEGEIRFSTDQQSEALTTGKMITLHERIPHEVLARKESVFLLTLTRIM